MDQVMHRGALALLRSVAIGAIFSLPLLGLALAGPKEERKVDPANQRKELARILTNEALWGKDLPDALAHLGAWGELKETKVIVFPKSIVGATPQKEAVAAQHLKTLTESIKAAPAGFRPEFEHWIKSNVREGAPQLKAEIVPLVEDNSRRLAWTANAVQFLSPGLTIATVQNKIGGPETVTREVIQNEEGERRPVVLTLYHYAGGAIAFAESDLQPKPGVVDRVILEVPAVQAALFQEGK